MNFFEKLLTVLKNNLAYTVLLAVAIILFGVFANGLFYGLITAASTVLAYVCIERLYKEYMKKPAPKKAAAKPAPKKSAVKPAAKKAPVKKK